MLDKTKTTIIFKYLTSFIKSILLIVGKKRFITL
jgi:hypothetical protein